MKRFISWTLAVLLLAGLATYFSDPHYWQRYAGVFKSRVFELPRGNYYDPLAEVTGQSGKPLARWSASELTLPVAALDQAQAYVANRNSSSFMVWHDGAVARESYFGDTQADSLITSKSMAKPLSSMVVARALEQGLIKSLDQSAADFIEEWQGTDKAAITVRHILNMSSGLERFYRDTLNPFSSFHKGFLSGKHEEYIVSKVPLVETPGSYYDYSQITSDLVAVLIERASGKPYHEYLASELLSPIGAAGGEIWLNREGGVAHSGCCIMLPADTWLRLGVLMVQGGVWEGQQILPSWWNSEILKGSPANPNYGLYFFLGSPYTARRYVVDPEHLDNPGTLQSEPYAADDLIMFDGNGNQVVYIVPSRKLVIVRTGGWPGKDADGGEWDNTYLPNILIKALDQGAKADTKSDDKPRPFSAAMQNYKPLGKVAGDFRPMFEPAMQSATGELAAAVDYAKNASSYGLLVWHRGKLVLEEYFKGFDQNLRPDTASMHKSVLALLLAAAVEDGFIKSLDEPVGNYVEQWRDQPRGEATIAQVLNMSSGLRKLSAEGGLESPAYRFFAEGESVRQTTLGLQREVAPGSRFLYANTNSQLLALVLESATKMPYADYLSQRLWQQLGAEDAYVWYNEAETLTFPRAYSALLARPRDWLRVGLLIKDKGVIQGKRVLSADSIDALTTPSPAYSNYAKHIWLGRDYEAKRFYNDKKEGVGFTSKEPFLAGDMIYFDGIGGQRVYISREQDLVVVRVGDMNFEWDDTYLPNLVYKTLADK